jgi:hypothetical protein
LCFGDPYAELFPIIRYQGLVLDGRNRLLACERAGVEPTFTDYEGDDAGARALVISLNVQRRDLSAGQRAVVAARALEQMPERRGGDRKSKDRSNCTDHAAWSREVVAKTFKVGVNGVQQAARPPLPLPRQVLCPARGWQTLPRRAGRAGTARPGGVQRGRPAAR